MRHICNHCNAQVDHKNLESHAVIHNKELAEPQSINIMFREQTHKCAGCKNDTLVRRMGKMICQHCSYISRLYADLI